MKFNILHTAVLAFFMLLTACQKGPGTLSSKEGEIDYAIDYVENSLKKVSADMLPKKMTTQYRANGFVFEIEGFFGLFSISNVVVPKKDVNETRISVLDKKFYYAADKINEPAIGFGTMPIPKIKYSDETKVICGFTCHKALAQFPGEPEPLVIYYTDEIPIKNPNRTTPFKNIDGVLMEFYIQLHNIRMHLVASGVTEKPIPETIFMRPDGEKKASRKYLEAVLFKLLDTE